MKSIVMIIAGLGMMVFAYSQKPSPNGKEQHYKYYYVVSTGISEHVFEKDKQVPIKFHPNSDSLALKLLQSLRTTVLYPSNERIRLVGRLYDEIKEVPDGYYNSDSTYIHNADGREKYKEFELKHWYILCPFEEYKWSNGVGSKLIFTQRKFLSLRDFGVADSVKLDISRFQKKK